MSDICTIEQHISQKCHCGSRELKLIGKKGHTNIWTSCIVNGFKKRFKPPLYGIQIISTEEEALERSQLIINGLDAEYNYTMSILEGDRDTTISYLKSKFDIIVMEYQNLFINYTCGVTPYLKFVISDMYEKTKKKEQCFICLEDIDSKTLKTGKCGHMCHDSCIKRWIKAIKKTSCPKCNNEF